MIWWYASTRHDLAIGPFARNWLRSSQIDRLLIVLIYGMAWWIFWGLVAVLTRSAVLFFITGLVPWLVWTLDAVIDRYHTRGDLNNLMAIEDRVVLATRAEYIGGHPDLPHGRFAYLTIEGSQQNPLLTISFPKQVRNTSDGTTALGYDCFNIPLLDIGKTSEKADSVESMTGTLLASLQEKPGKLFSQERVTLKVEYQGEAGRKHIVELTNFLRGSDEVRNWRNYLVCAQAEADTGYKPYGPWASLKPEIPSAEVTPSDPTGNGSKMRPARRAFERR